MEPKKLDYWFQTVAALGYPALFLGLIVEFTGIPFPGEIVLTFTGFLVSNGHLDFGLALLAAVSGSVVGTVIAYFAGRNFGRPFLEQYGRYAFLTGKKIMKAERWFNKHCYLVLLFGRFVPGVRPLSAYMAGIARMKFALFLPVSMIGTFIWCFVFMALGRQLGRNWSQVAELLKNYNLVVLGLITAVIIFYLARGLTGFRRKRANSR